jgi:hypothetical protein
MKYPFFAIFIEVYLFICYNYKYMIEHKANNNIKEWDIADEYKKRLRGYKK